MTSFPCADRIFAATIAAASPKLGGMLPLVVYDWFRCSIGEDGIGYVLEKTSGSQRLSGHFVDDTETSLIFYGAGHYGDEEPRAYGDDAERNMVGRFVKVGDDRYRLELPLPQFEFALRCARTAEALDERSQRNRPSVTIQFTL